MDSEDGLSNLEDLPLELQEKVYTELIANAYEEADKDDLDVLDHKRRKRSDDDSSSSASESDSESTVEEMFGFRRYFDSEEEEGSDKRIKCRFCAQWGHRYANCPNRIVTCHLCSEQHLPSRCPLITRVCWSCGMMGHNKNQCDNKPLFSRDFCDYCNKRGHNEMTCGFIWRTYHLTKSASKTDSLKIKDRATLWCAHCASDSHLADECSWPYVPYSVRNYSPTIYSREFISKLKAYCLSSMHILESVKVNTGTNQPVTLNVVSPKKNKRNSSTPLENYSKNGPSKFDMKNKKKSASSTV